MTLTSSELLAYLVAIILLFVLYKKIIAPFTKKMLEIQTDTEKELEYEGISFEDIEVEDTSKAELEAKLNKMRKQLSVNDMDEEKVKYDMLLERLKKIAHDDTESITEVLSDLSKERKQ